MEDSGSENKRFSINSPLGSIEWANERLRFAIATLKGEVESSIWKRRLQTALIIKEELLSYGFTWQAKRIENWIHRLQHQELKKDHERMIERERETKRRYGPCRFKLFPSFTGRRPDLCVCGERGGLFLVGSVIYSGKRGVWRARNPAFWRNFLHLATYRANQLQTHGSLRARILLQESSPRGPKKPQSYPVYTAKCSKCP